MSDRVPPNTALELTPLRVERDQEDFGSWFWLEHSCALHCGAAKRPPVGGSLGIVAPITSSGIDLIKIYDALNEPLCFATVQKICSMKVDLIL
jgi:hypothetical protein